MIIYNVTYSVANSIEEQWLNWMTEIHIPEILNTRSYIRYQLVKIIDIDEDGSATYAVQYYAQTKQNHVQFINLHDTSFKLKCSRQWGEEVLSFGTLMQIVQ